MKAKPIPPKVKPKPKLNIPQTLSEHPSEENLPDTNNNHQEISLQKEREAVLHEINSDLNEAIEEFEQIYQELRTRPSKANIEISNGINEHVK